MVSRGRLGPPSRLPTPPPDLLLELGHDLLNLPNRVLNLVRLVDTLVERLVVEGPHEVAVQGPEVLPTDLPQDPPPLTVTSGLDPLDGPYVGVNSYN